MDTTFDSRFKNYVRKEYRKMRPYVPGEDITGLIGDYPVEDGGMISLDLVIPGLFYTSEEELKDFELVDPAFQASGMIGASADALTGRDEVEDTIPKDMLINLWEREYLRGLDFGEDKHGAIAGANFLVDALKRKFK